MEKAKIRAAAYCRVSTEQELQDLSFESQCHYYRQLIESDPEMELVDIYGDHHEIRIPHGEEPFRFD